MKKEINVRAKPKSEPGLDVGAFLRAAVAGKNVVVCQPGDRIFAQGEAANSVYYLEQGVVEMSVVSRGGKAAVIARLGDGEFFGESALTGHPVWLKTAIARAPTTLLVLPKEAMTRVLHDKPDLVDPFITHMLVRNIRLEEDLIDQLFNSSEQRLARALLLLARYGTAGPDHRKLPRITHETLAEMIGTTRSRVTFFMNKFRRLGFIEYNGGLKVKHSLLNVIRLD